MENIHSNLMTIEDSIAFAFSLISVIKIIIIIKLPRKSLCWTFYFAIVDLNCGNWKRDKIAMIDFWWYYDVCACKIKETFTLL